MAIPTNHNLLYNLDILAKKAFLPVCMGVGHAGKAGPASLSGRPGKSQSAMTKTTAFEIHTLKDGLWQLDSVHENKDDALYEARRMYDNSKHIGGIKVLQEEYDDEANRSSTFVLYNEVRGTAKIRPTPKPPEEKKEIIRPKTAPKPEGKGTFTQYMLLMVLGVGAALLAIIGAAFYYMDVFK
jgi:hypothetical protein